MPPDAKPGSTAVCSEKDDNVVEGPDLNESRSPFDKKVYRQILLPNGLRAVLVSDTVAMAQSYNAGGLYEYDEDEDEYEDSDESSEEDDGDEDGEGDSIEGGLRNAAAAMVVGVGTYYDPPECQGMAHFLEHLLFMGSKKYPEENAYDKFMSTHGGSDNAFTELEHTVFHFEIPQEHLANALDMFAQFFTHPLLLGDSVERELQSIESEFQLVKNSDNCRVQHLMCHTCGQTKEQHPFAKFSWGNYQSLKEIPEKFNVDIMQKLRSFYQEHYFASNMRLVVIGGYSLDYLQNQVIKSFSDIRSNEGLVPSWDDIYQSALKDVGFPFRKDHIGDKIWCTAPVKDRHDLSVAWQIPCQFQNWRTKPCDYLGHLLGHEAKGSLLASLKEKSWATACYAGMGSEGYENSSSHAIFNVSISLSEQGVANWTKVVAELYQYVGMIRYHCQEGLPQWIYDELRSIQEVAHKYDDEQSPEDLVETLAEELSPVYNLPPDRLLDGTSLLFEYDPASIKDLVDNYFTPSNARLDMVSSTFGRAADYEHKESTNDTTPLPPSTEFLDPTTAGPPQKEPVFGTYYWCQALPKMQLQEWADLAKAQLPPADSFLSLPEKNPFIPLNFSLKALPAADCDHPLLNCSIKLQISVGKRKEWFPATVTQYNSIKNQILLSYEDEDEKWHKVDAIISDFTPELLTSADFEGTLDSKKIKYRVVALAMDGEGAIRKFGDDSDLDVKGFPPIPPARPPSRLPKLVGNSALLKLFHLQDRTFKRPIAELRLQLHCGAANISALHGACADLLVYLVSDSLTEISYMASVCELGSSLSANDGGFSMRVHGFDDKLLNLFLYMFKLLLSFRDLRDGRLPDSIQDGRFDLCLESYRRNCTNSGMKASKLSTSIRVRCLRPTSWTANQKLKAIENLDIRTFAITIAEIMNTVGAEGLYHGNVDVSDAKRAQKEITELIQGPGLPRKKYPRQFVLQVPQKSISLRCASKDPTDPNTAVEVYFQVGKDKTIDRVMVDLLMEMMYEPLYDQIRTKDQFGYDVSCDSRWTNGVIGMQIVVVTSSKSAQQAEDRIEKFLFDFRKTMVDMSRAEFMEHLAALAKQKLDMFNSLSDETGHYWSEIRDGRYQWQVEREEVIVLKTITKEQALESYDRWLVAGNVKRRRVAIQVISSEGPASDGRPEITSESIGDFNDECIKDFHKHCKNQTFGRIY